jgi:hypothetical protein
MELQGDMSLNLFLVHLEIVLVWEQDRSTVCAERAIGSEIILDTPDGSATRRGSCAISFWSVWRHCLCRCKIGAQFAPNIPQAQKSFWMHPMELLGDVGHVVSHFGPFGDSISVSAR